MAYRVQVRGLGGVVSGLRGLQRFPRLFLEEAADRIADEGLRQLRDAVPRETGALRRSFQVRADGGGLTVGSTDPAAEHIRFRRGTGRWGYTVEQTIRGWQRSVLPRLLDEAADAAYNRATRGT